MSALDMVVAYKLIKILSTPWEKTDAYKLGIIDDKGKVLKKKSQLSGSQERAAYTVFHKIGWNIKRIFDRLPFLKSRMGSFAAALWLLKEETGCTKERLEEVFYNYLRENYPDVLSDLLAESFEEASSVSAGIYILDEEKLVIENNIDSFETMLGIPLFKHNGRLFTKKELKLV
tara:strand:+ start:15543 stop:16064 length:522 start_codon:yes stop_codon:yes gene_type:complete